MSDANKIPEGSCPHCSPAPAEAPCCAPAEGSTGCGCRHKQRTEEEYKHLITRLNRIEGQIRGIRSMVEKAGRCRQKRPERFYPGADRPAPEHLRG